MFWRLFLPFLMWLFSALESSGFRSSNEHKSSPETLMTAPQLSNSPQYCQVCQLALLLCRHRQTGLTLGAEKTVTKIRSLKNS